MFPKVKCCAKFNSWDFQRDPASGKVDLWAEDRWVVLDDIQFCPYCGKSVGPTPDGESN